LSSKVVLCHGVFDFFHWGHLRHIQEARKYGDVLVVSITADAFVAKGPGRPLFSEQQRLEVLRSLACVDEVDLIHDKTALPAIEKHRPAFYVKGADYNNTRGHSLLALERAAVEQLGGKVVFTEHESGMSTTELVRRIFNVFRN